MNEILAAFQSMQVWGCVVGAWVLIWPVSLILAPQIYNQSKNRKDSMGVAAAVATVFVVGVILTTIMLLQKPNEWMSYAVVLTVMALGVGIIFFKAKQKSYHRARTSADIAVGVGTYLSTLLATGLGYFVFKFNSSMMILTGFCGVLAPMVIYSFLFREKNV